MPRTVLLTIGRMPKALEVARALAGAGHRVLVADPFAWHISRVSRVVARTFRTRAPNSDRAGYLEDLLDIIRRERVELVVPLSEETMHVVGLQGRLPDGVTLYSSDRDLIRTLHDKLRFNALAASLGLTVPATARLGGTPDAGTAPAEAVSAATALAARGETVVKPVYSCAGMGVEYFAAGAPLPAPTPTPQLVQARVRGRARSTFTVAHHGRVITTAVYKGTVMQGTVSVCFERVSDQAAVEAWVAEFVRATGYHGFVSFDFIVDDDGVPWAIECNPRATSGVHFLESRELAAAIVPATDGEIPSPIPFRAQHRFQQFLNTLTETQRAMFTGKRFGDKLRQLLSASDVVWSARDPWPFLLMTPVSYEILYLSIFKGMPMGEAATHDIGWFKELPADHPGQQMLGTPAGASV